MKIITYVQLWVCCAAASSRRGMKVHRQEGPVDPGTAPDCTYFDTALDSSYTCSFFESSWSISHEDFVDWNPSVKKDCNNIKVGNSYCVEVNNGLPRPSTKPMTSATPTNSPTPTSTGTLKPSPTQAGLIDKCQRFYKAVDGDTCYVIVNKFGTFSQAEFLSWNPAVGEECQGLWLNYYYCIGVAGTPTTKRPTSTIITKATSTSKPSSGPSPTQSGIAANCQRYYQAVKDDICQKIVDKFGTFTLKDFQKWNPAVGADCGGLWLGYWYCIGVPGTPTTTRKATSSSTRKVTPTPTNTCNPSAPQPTQPGARCGCKKWHKVASGNTCDIIIKQYKISKGDFDKWNPQVGSDCQTLWLDYHVCVGA